MKTLLALNNYYYVKGGAEVVYFEHNRLMQSQGWDIVPFAMQHEKNQLSEWSAYFVEEIEFGNSYSMLEKIKMATKVVYSFEAKKKISQLIVENSPDIAHGHNIYHHISPSVLHVLKAHNIPTVLTLHDLKIACPAYRMLTKNEVCEQCKGGAFSNVIKNKCIKNSVVLSSLIWVETIVHGWLKSYQTCVDAFVVPSKFYIDKFVEWGYPRERFHYIPNFVDTQQFLPNYNVGDYFLYFGRLSEEKGLSTLIKAAAHANVTLKIAGTGDIQSELMSLAESEKCDIEFLGHVSGNALHDVVRGAIAVVLPSEWYENAPLSVMEAYALGKPVIGANIGGIPEMVDHMISGAHYASGDHFELAELMLQFVAMDPATVAEMGKAGRARVEKEFSPQQYKESIDQLYAGLLNRIAADNVG